MVLGVLKRMKVKELAAKLEATVDGDGDLELTGCGSLDSAGPGDLSFMTNHKYISQLLHTRAGAVVISPDDVKHNGNGRTLIISADPYYCFRQAMVLLIGFHRHPEPGISEQANIAESVQIGSACYIGPYVCIEEGVRIGDHCVIYPHCYIGRQAEIGNDCILYPNVSIYHACILRDRITLHSSCVIGEDGFGYATQNGVHHKIPPSGNVVIENDVEMGANCSVDRATLGSTQIGEGTKFSNGVTIGHGSQVGRHNLFVAQVGLAGSVQTGDYVAIGGQVGIAGHLKIGDQAQIAATSAVMHDIPPKSTFGGSPAVPLQEAFRAHVYSQKLPEMAATIKRLQKRINELEKKLNSTDDGVKNEF